MAEPAVPSIDLVTAAVADFPDPETGRPLSDLGQLRPLRAAADRIELEVALTSHSAILHDLTRGRIAERLQARFPGVPVEVRIVGHDRPPGKLGQIGLEAKSVIAVGSGKGGVGKSTIAASIAMSEGPSKGSRPESSS